MADVEAKDLDNHPLTSRHARAELTGRSVEEGPRYVLTEAALAARREWAEELRKLHAEMRAENGGPLPDSTPGIREERDSWG